MPRVLERRGEDVDLWWWWGWRCLRERERRWWGLGVEDGMGGGGNGRGGWTWGGGGALGGAFGSGSGGGGGSGWWMGMGGWGNGEPGGACGRRGSWTWGGGGVPGGARVSRSGNGGGPGWASCTAGGGRERLTWGGVDARVAARGGQERRERGPRGSRWHLGERERREWVVEARWWCGECGRQARVCRAGGERERRCLRDPASSLESGQSGGVGGSWGASRGAAWYRGGGGAPLSMDPPRRGVVAAAACGMGRVTVSGGVGPGGPLRRGRGGRGDTVPRTGGMAGTGGGWSLVVGGVCGWSARWLPSHTLVLFVHGWLWPGGVGWWAVVVVGVVLVVMVVGPLVVVALVVVGLVLRVWPLDPLWVFWSPLWGWGVGHRSQPLGLHCLVGRGGRSGAGLDGDGGRGVPRPWVGLAGGGGGLWGMDDGALGDGDVDEGLDGVVSGGRLCGAGGCRWEGGVGCGGGGVLAWVRVWVRAVSVGFVSLRLWCCVCSLGCRFGFGVGSGVGVRFEVEEDLCPEV